MASENEVIAIPKLLDLLALNHIRLKHKVPEWGTASSSSASSPPNAVYPIAPH
jgi:hypothetical protein